MLSLRIAWRFLRSAWTQTLSITLGIAVGVSVQVFIGSLITGLQASLIDKTIGSQSQITISTVAEGDFITDYDEITTYLETVDNVKSIGLSIETGAVLIDDTRTRNILVRGLDMEGSEDIYGFSERFVVDGSTLPDTANEVLIGITTATKLSLSIGDSFSIYLPPAVNGSGEGTYYPVTISGIFDFRITSLNDTWVITTLSTVQDILGVGDVVSKIETQVSDVFATDQDAIAIADALDNDLIQVVDWKSQNAELLSGLAGQSSSSIMIQVFVTLSVVLGIASVLAITVLQKSRQIGILKAMGISNRKASLIFLFQGMILGVFGAILGVGLGIGLLTSFTTFALNEVGEPIIPLLIDPSFMALSAVIAFVSASLASVLPAQRSKKISIIEVIKNG